MKLCPFSSREEVIWAAGLFEGEGWISVQKFSPCMGIQMTEKETLERFAKAVGGGPIYYRKPKVYKYEIIHTRKEQWAWRVTGFENVQAVISYLWNWLGPRRRLRAKEVLVFAKLGKAKPGMPKGYKISGWNNVGTCYGMHAEIHCLLRANRKRLPGSTLYVASQRQRNLKPVTSKPCLECAAAIRWAKIGKVLWRAGDERWIEETYA